MRQLVTKPFPFFVGLYSLEELVTRNSRVCVINILGNESRKVTPVSHEYSKGNVVAGVQYGRRGILETLIGDIPVYRSIRDVNKHGHAFDMGVVYLPPAAVSQAVWELVTYNKDLKRIVIVTEKVPVRDTLNVRYICQDAGVDVIGCNCLGVANAWDHVRVGGALGGDKPEETLQKGSIAIHSNSGNFTTTIATYLQTAGFGISTAVSSGKDVYIHFAAPEFLYAAQNDPRTKAVVLYVEPGGYYEKQALDWITDRLFSFNKPIVACVTGRWKKGIARPCGHAGAMAGSGDDAESKERWFDSYFGVPAFDPEHPSVGKKGVRVASIQHIPAAMAAIFDKMDEKPDFQPRGDLSLKPWLEDKLVKLPHSLQIPVVKAVPPYDAQIQEISRQVGANYLRQNMRNKSGATRMNPATQVAELHGKTVLDLSKNSFEENLFFSIGQVLPDKADLRRVNLLLNGFLRTGDNRMPAAEAARLNNATPNAVVAAEIAAVGNHPMLEKVHALSVQLLDLIREHQISDESTPLSKELDRQVQKLFLSKEKPVNRPFEEALEKEIRTSTKLKPPFRLCRHILESADGKGQGVKDRLEFLLAAFGLCLFWNPMLGKRIPRQAVEDSITYIYLVARISAVCAMRREKNPQWEKLSDAEGPYSHPDFTDSLFRLLFGRKPEESELVELKYLLGLTLTNGPGTLSAKGAKESVSARNAVSMAFVGFLSNTGLAHGGNGFEAVEYLLDRFESAGVEDPGDAKKKPDLKVLANQAAKEYGKYKKQAKTLGLLEYKRIPCINHPVFKGNDINIDPREDFVRKELETRGVYNVFLDFYHHLVKELFDEGVTENVFCVNVDAVLAVIALKLIWPEFLKGLWPRRQIQDLVFILFLLGRSIGTTAEIIDHRSRGQDMDCRTPQGEVAFVL